MYEHDLESVLLRALAKMTPALNQIRDTKHIQMQFDRWKIELTVTPMSPRPAQRSETEETEEPEESASTMRNNILDALGTSSMKGEPLAMAAGYSYSGRIRVVLSEMRREGLLKWTKNDGYSVRR